VPAKRDMKQIILKDIFLFFNDNRRVTSSCWRNHRHLISSQLSTKQFLTRGQVTLMAMTFRHFTLFVDTAARVLLFPTISMNRKMFCSSTSAKIRITSGYVTQDRTYLTRPLRRRNDKGQQLFLKAPYFREHFNSN
jgi:hypothetical protein